MENSRMASLALWSFYVVLFLKFTYASTSYGIFFSFLSSFIALVITFVLYHTKLRAYNRIKIFLLLMFFWGCSCSIFSCNYRINDYILIIQYFGVALIPIFYRLNYSLFKWTLWILIFYFIMNIVKGIDPNEVFSTSRNNISVFLLIFYSYHTISAIQNGKKINILMLAISFFIGVWAIGRGGILTLGFLLLLMPLCRDNKISSKLIIVYIFTLLAVIVLLSFLADSILRLAISRIDSMGIDSNGRDEPNAEYVRMIFDSIFSFFFGANLPGNSVFEALDLNPHNSLIRLHVYYGLLGFIAVVFYSLRSLFKYFIGKNYVYIILFIALFVRSLVDSTAFHGPFDGLFLYFIFNTFYSSGHIYRTL